MNDSDISSQEEEAAEAFPTVEAYTGAGDPKEEDFKGADESMVYNSYFDTPPDEPVEKKHGVIQALIGQFKPTYILDHLDYKSFKKAFRSWVQIWSTVFLTVIPKCHLWLGSAAYILQIMGFIAVSGGTPIVYNVWIALVCSFYASVGLLFGTIALKISHTIRGSPTVEQIIGQLIEEGTCTAENAQVCFNAQIYTGRYLRTDCSMIFIVALIVGITLLGLSQKINPTVRLGFIAGVISLCINLCYGVYFPIFSPLTIGILVCKPIWIAMAFKVVCSILIFPETASHVYFNGSTALLRKLRAASVNNLRFFRSMKPSESNFENYSSFYKDIIAIRNGVIPMELMASFSRFEISYGRLGPGAIGEIRSSIKNLLNAFASFEYYYQTVNMKRKLSTGESLKARSYSVVSSLGAQDHHFKIFGSIHESYKPVGDYENFRRKRLIQERLRKDSNVVQLVDLDFVCDLLKQFFEPYIVANNDAFSKILEWLDAANLFRIYTLFYKRKQHADKQRELQHTLRESRKELTKLILTLENCEKFEENFHGRAKDEETMLTLITQCSLLTFFIGEQTRCLIKLMDVLLEIDEQVPKPKIFTYFTHSIFENPGNTFTSLQDEVPQSEIPIYRKPNSVEFRDPDSAAPSSIFHLLGYKLVKLYNLLLNDSLWFWIRSGFLSFACAALFFNRNTAAWYFNNRLIWSVIMCALSTSEYTGETIYAFMAKLAGTFCGCLLGMVGWYISTGNGKGNYYGFTAVTGVLAAFLCYYRHFSVHLTLIPAIVFPVSTTLVMGTSWADVNGNPAGNIGVGFKVAWIRFVSVVVGLSVAFLASVIPRPKSSKAAIRKILAAIIGEIGNIHCDITEFALQRIDNPTVHIVPRHDPIVARFRLILVKLANISHLMVPIKHEISFTGTWPKQKYLKLQEVVTDIIQLYQYLHLILDRVGQTDHWIKHIVNRAGWYDIDMNADIFSIVHMCSGSLGSKQPLPKVTQATISIKHFDILRLQWGINKFSLNERFYNDLDTYAEVESRANAEAQDDIKSSELHKSMVDNLDYAKLFSHDGNLNIVALVLCHIIYLRLDEVAIITKSLVGEKYDLAEHLFSIQHDFKNFKFE